MVDELYIVRKKLKEGVNYGSKVAGLCLLGEKDNLVDSFVPMLMKKGCYDSPQVSHAEFEKAFLKMVNKDRAVMGMALIRPKTYDASLPRDFAENIKNMKHAFKDIKNTVWLVISAEEIKTYGIIKDSKDRINFTECEEGVFTRYTNSKMLRIAKIRQEMKGLDASDTAQMRKHLSRLAKSIDTGTSGVQILRNIEEEKGNIEIRRQERLEKLKKQREARKAREDKQKQLLKEQNERADAKEARVKAGMKDTKDIGGGYFLIKDKNGKEILWKK